MGIESSSRFSWVPWHRPLDAARAASRLALRVSRALVNLVVFALGMATLLLLLAAAAIYTGVFDVTGAAYTPAPARLVIDAAVHRAVQRSAEGIVTPDLTGLERLSRGAVLYQTSCEACHRAPGAERTAIASALNPAPADLSLEARRWTPPQVFFITKNGLRMSGMPAWRTVYSDDELWDIVSVVTRLPGMSASEYAELKRTGAPAR